MAVVQFERDTKPKTDGPWTRFERSNFPSRNKGHVEIDIWNSGNMIHPHTIFIEGNGYPAVRPSEVGVSWEKSARYVNVARKALKIPLTEIIREYDRLLTLRKVAKASGFENALPRAFGRVNTEIFLSTAKPFMDQMDMAGAFYFEQALRNP